jgi:hypothetical protein
MRSDLAMKKKKPAAAAGGPKAAASMRSNLEAELEDAAMWSSIRAVFHRVVSLLYQVGAAQASTDP